MRNARAWINDPTPPFFLHRIKKKEAREMAKKAKTIYLAGPSGFRLRAENLPSKKFLFSISIDEGAFNKGSEVP